MLDLTKDLKLNKCNITMSDRMSILKELTNRKDGY